MINAYSAVLKLISTNRCCGAFTFCCAESCDLCCIDCADCCDCCGPGDCDCCY